MSVYDNQLATYPGFLTTIKEIKFKKKTALRWPCRKNLLKNCGDLV